MVVRLVKKAFHPSLFIAIISLAVMMTVFLFRNVGRDTAKSISPTHETSTATTHHKININTANIDALQQIPGIGPSIAEAIITYRDSNGPFHDPAQLLNIPGIGEKKLVTLLDYVYWEE